MNTTPATSGMNYTLEPGQPHPRVISGSIEFGELDIERMVIWMDEQPLIEITDDFGTDSLGIIYAFDVTEDDEPGALCSVEITDEKWLVSDTKGNPMFEVEIGDESVRLRKLFVAAVMLEELATE